MARTYNIRIEDSNECTVAYFDDLDEEGFMTILRKIVPLKGTYVSVSITLKDDREPAPYTMPDDWRNRPFSKEPF